MRAIERGTVRAKAWAVVKGDFAEAVLDGFSKGMGFMSTCMAVMSILAALFYPVFLSNFDVSVYRIVFSVLICLAVAAGNIVVGFKVNDSIFIAKSKCFYGDAETWFEDRLVLGKIVGMMDSVGYWVAKVSAFLIVGLSTGAVCLACIVDSEVLVSIMIIAAIPIILYIASVIYLWITAGKYWEKTY